MPDGDRFSWSVRGKGSRVLLNLARSGAEPSLVADQGARVVTAHLNEPSVRTVLPDALQIIAGALPRFETDASIDPRSSSSVRLELREARARSGNDAAAALTTRSAEQVYLRLSASGRAISQTELKQEIRKGITTAVLEHSVFASARAEIALKSCRSPAEELAWEEQLSIEVAERLDPTFNKVFDKTSAGNIRAPRRRTAKQDFTVERLNRALPTVIQ